MILKNRKLALILLGHITSLGFFTWYKPFSSIILFRIQAQIQAENYTNISDIFRTTVLVENIQV